MTNAKQSISHRPETRTVTEVLDDFGTNIVLIFHAGYRCHRRFLRHNC